MELRYCPQYERLYDGPERQWIPFLRGKVCLVQAIYPREGEISGFDHPVGHFRPLKIMP